jgi:hypothetical protein
MPQQEKRFRTDYALADFLPDQNQAQLVNYSTPAPDSLRSESGSISQLLNTGT